MSVRNKTIFRLHISSPAGHTTYKVYASLKSAKKNLEKMSDKSDWYATHIEKIKSTTSMKSDKSIIVHKNKTNPDHIIKKLKRRAHRITNM